MLKIKREKINNEAIEVVLNYVIIPKNYKDIILNKDKKYVEIIKNYRNDDENIIIDYRKGYLILSAGGNVINITPNKAINLINNIMSIHKKNLIKDIENGKKDIKNKKSNGEFLNNQLN